jgi:predicted alpha/beta superfamily hydrolase
MREGEPVTIPGARQFEVASKITGGTYRIMIAAPSGMKAGETYPVVYLLDGNYYFATACDILFVNKLSAIVVGVGYPTADYDEMIVRRKFDLTPSAAGPGYPAGHYGGGDAFLQMIEEEVKPLVRSRYPVDMRRQSLYGASLGGLMVVRQLFQHPAAYSTYLVASPALWWNGSEVLREEAAFAERVRHGDFHLRVHVTSAENEQYRGAEPALRQRSEQTRMVDNARELTLRLQSVAPEKLSVAYSVFPNEDHVSASQSNLARALRYALRRE